MDQKEELLKSIRSMKAADLQNLQSALRLVMPITTSLGVAMLLFVLISPSLFTIATASLCLMILVPFSINLDDVHTEVKKRMKEL